MNNLGLEAYYIKCIKTIYLLEDTPNELLAFLRKLKEENSEKYSEILNFKKTLEYEITNLKQVILDGADPIINDDLLTNV